MIDPDPKMVRARPTVNPERERTELFKFVSKANNEAVAWFGAVGRTIYAAPTERRKALSDLLARLAALDRVFFYQAYLPMVENESFMVNLVNDRDLPVRKQSIGYTGLQVRTARLYAKRLGYVLPKRLRDARQWLIAEWEANLEIGRAYLYDCWKASGQDGLLAMSAYRTGLAGAEAGRTAITERMKRCRTRSALLLERLKEAK